MFDDDRRSALERLGWTASLTQQFLALAESQLLAGAAPSRVATDHGREYTLALPEGTCRATLARRLLIDRDPLERPCVGDWVLAGGEPGQPASIEHVFERTTVFVRKASGATSRPQAIAANVDLAVVVCSLSRDDASKGTVQRGLNPRRVERYLRAASGAGARTLVVVNKADLCEDARASADALRSELGIADVVLVSAQDGRGVAELAERILPRETAVIVGPSGVGKSTLVNRALGRSAQRVTPVREGDTRGRHTTTHRELFVLPSGGIVIDTPGMRELALFESQDSSDGGTGFSDIDELARACRFANCRHDTEPGCAVRAAVADGRLSESRLVHAFKLERELERQKERYDALSRSEARRKRRTLSRQVRSAMRKKPK